jgi:hypothetical protein
MEKLYTAYMVGEGQARELVLEQPWLFLEAEESAPLPESETTPAEGLLDDLRLLGAVSRRLVKRLKSGLMVRLPPFEKQRAQRLWQAAQLDLQALSQRGKGDFADAGPSP